jgi:PAP2 superfamily
MASATPTRRTWRGLRFAATQLAVWASLYAAYLFVRSLAIHSAGHAFAHAAQLIDLEHASGLLQEVRVQQAVASVKELRVFFDLYYMLGFGPLLGLTLVWLGLRNRTAYRQLRTAMLASLALASFFFVLYPTAPPRLVQGLGISDTVGLSGHDTGSFAGIHFDPYAAMPSMHVGWSLLLALVAIRLVRGLLARVLVSLHPVLMTLAVTATGNHFFVDAAAGMAVALLGYALVSCRALRRIAGVRLVRTLHLGSARCPAPQAA